MNTCSGECSSHEYMYSHAECIHTLARILYSHAGALHAGSLSRTYSVFTRRVTCIHTLSVFTHAGALHAESLSLMWNNRNELNAFGGTTYLAPLYTDSNCSLLSGAFLFVDLALYTRISRHTNPVHLVTRKGDDHPAGGGPPQRLR
jgi:hypothetical protein